MFEDTAMVELFVRPGMYLWYFDRWARWSVQIRSTSPRSASAVLSYSADEVPPIATSSPRARLWHLVYTSLSSKRLSDRLPPSASYPLKVRLLLRPHAVSLSWGLC